MVLFESVTALLWRYCVARCGFVVGSFNVVGFNWRSLGRKIATLLVAVCYVAPGNCLTEAPELLHMSAGVSAGPL